ncbi:duboraya [Brachionichthys hirsutus]|uniref:duboraya n=1 Tax=Brachionichthys hirsutus TaxID=412623 RepID=UPI0036049EDF
MEEDASSRRSVAELAGRFKDSAPPHDAAGQGTEKPVRRRPPRSLQLPKTQDQEEPPDVISPLPAKAKRNSALIERLQANLALSPSALLPSPKSPGFRVLPPVFPHTSPSSTPGTSGPTSPSPVAASPISEEEGPVSFEAPPTVEDWSILSNSNIKGRARHSIRRRPPSRRHRQSSSGEEVSIATEEGAKSLPSPSGPGDKMIRDVFLQDGETVEVKEDKIEGSVCPEKNRSDQDDRQASRGEEKKEREEESAKGKAGVGSSLGGKEEEEEAQEQNTEKTALTEVAANTDDKEEEQMEETASRGSVR